ncbi:hypothetical protein IAG41_12370 [Sphingomonas sp. JC676]|uniref:hypothetical protein n=1 Tax=Sphingomonas sp. JC676 TaxID=2768065 RepID=UPI0016580937|nr:hypothetical protein [Sphingomonas sp. JC676]MBC9033185.1 hypothetical protein [Sphingomonas sp. JC676]
MTGDDLIDRFLARLLREQGGTRRRWRNVLGAVRVYSAATHAHCNWSITPTGSAADVAAVEAVSDALRSEYPILVT